MSVETNNKPVTNETAESNDAPAAPREPLGQRLQAAFSELRLPLTLGIAFGMAALWCYLFLSFNWLQVLAGLVPVTAGLVLGRVVKKQLLLHGIVLGLSGFVFGLGIVFVYGLLADGGIVPAAVVETEPGVVTQLSRNDLLLYYLSFSVIALVPFPIFGAIMSKRGEERQQAMREQIEERGGKLERASVVRTLEDLRGLSLPQFGGYVRDLFKKHDFLFQDYRFEKDKHLDLEMVHQDEHYLLRLSVDDKVRPGVIETLNQDMKKRGIPKGLVITSTEFTAEALKAAQNRRNILVIDGATLYEIGEK